MNRSPIDLYTGPWTYGIDVSAYQPDVDWPLVARSECYVAGTRGGPCRFAIVRTSDGVETRRSSRPDPWAVRHLTGAHEAGLLVGAYHYLRAHHDARAQAELVLEVLRVAGVPCPIVALDLEGRPDDPSTPDTDESKGAWWRPDGAAPVRTADVLVDLVEMASVLDAAGHRVIIYTGVSWHWYVAQATITVPLALARLDLWTPYYTRGKRPSLPVGPRGKPWPWPHAEIWQAGGSASIPGAIAGVRGICDVNRFRGDTDALERWWTTSPGGCPI